MNYVFKIVNFLLILYFISFKFMKIIIIYVFIVLYESFVLFLNVVVNWYVFNSLMIIKSLRFKKG